MAQVNSKKAFQLTQQAFAAHLRDPGENPAPDDIEARRMGIYRDLVLNNIESFIANGFPVLRSISEDDHWQGMVRDFIRSHVCLSPYFIDIGKEFLVYLENERGAVVDDPPFLLELAHYEWVELALDISTEILPLDRVSAPDFLHDKLKVSPLAWPLSYRFPVHRIRADFQPIEPFPVPTFLVVYRNREDQVRFLEINAVTARLLQLLADGGRTGWECFTIIADEMGHGNPEQIASAGADLMHKLFSLSIIYTP